MLKLEKYLSKIIFIGYKGVLMLLKAFANPFSCYTKPKNIKWFCLSVRDIRAFKIEDYSDFTQEFQLNIN